MLPCVYVCNHVCVTLCIGFMCHLVCMFYHVLPCVWVLLCLLTFVHVFLCVPWCAHVILCYFVSDKMCFTSCVCALSCVLPCLCLFSCVLSCVCVLPYVLSCVFVLCCVCVLPCALCCCVCFTVWVWVILVLSLSESNSCWVLFFQEGLRQLQKMLTHNNTNISHSCVGSCRAWLRGRMIFTCRQPSLIMFSRERTKEENAGLDWGSSSQHCCISSYLKMEISVTKCHASHGISASEAFKCWRLWWVTWKQSPKSCCVGLKVVGNSLNAVPFLSFFSVDTTLILVATFIVKDLLWFVNEDQISNLTLLNHSDFLINKMIKTEDHLII